MALSRCPDPKQWQQLLLGRASDEAAARLEEHVEQCAQCSRLLATVPASDTLVQAMCARARFTLQASDRHVIQRLLPQLHQMRSGLPSGSGSASGDQTGAKAGLVSADVESFPFLRPAQAPGEIGRLGPYRVLKLLGHGGMGVVFLAEDPQLQRTVALKAMLPEVARSASARERFLREARAAAKIEHDHIVTIFQVGEDNGVPFLAMQLLKGMSLEDCLSKKQANQPGALLTVEQILKLGRETAKGLAAAHENSLIHRDIKPANIWLDATAGGRVKILDFGLARATDGTAPLTRLGTIIGTAAYMAPEQARSDRIDGRADLFSLGCVLYRLCTGRLPFRGCDATETLVAVTTEEPTPVQQWNPDLPPKLAQLVMKLLAKRPEDRPESARAAVEAIQAMEREQPALQARPVLPVAEPVSVATAHVSRAPTETMAAIIRHPVPRVKTSGRPLPLLLGAFAGVAVLILVGVVLLLRTRPSPGPTTTRDEEIGNVAPKYLPNVTTHEPGKSFVNSIGMKLAFIPPGKFLMGTSALEIKRREKEPNRGYWYQGMELADTPQHEVRIAKGFYLGVFEATQDQYQKVMGANPSVNKESPEHPADSVTWLAAMDFCKRLSALPEEKQAGRIYRLPTEAEWEYACRAGAMTTFHYGDSLSSRQANCAGPYGTAEKGPRLGKTVKVGSYEPNAWGLYDMHGNVWEWCLDGQRIYTANAMTDPRGSDNTGNRVMKGGSWREGAVGSAFRKARPETNYGAAICGLRVACD